MFSRLHHMRNKNIAYVSLWAVAPMRFDYIILYLYCEFFTYVGFRRKDFQQR